ncbi:Ent-kaur-16-ene synthase [Hibiscus syriacus]|uniref:Ent-kaur-16-ene synthase n=1 Tax=Hibiscus syriacus TaxID=106335 RepID=A0A6A2WWJ3_HIBSY|nr:Ent-kaur-16-ene synthase [Hibiscus syriacus]
MSVMNALIDFDSYSGRVRVEGVTCRVKGSANDVVQISSTSNVITGDAVVEETNSGKGIVLPANGSTQYDLSGIVGALEINATVDPLPYGDKGYNVILEEVKQSGKNTKISAASEGSIGCSVTQDKQTDQLINPHTKRGRGRPSKEGKVTRGASKNKFEILNTIDPDNVLGIYVADSGKKQRESSLGMEKLVQELKLKKKEHVDKVKFLEERRGASSSGCFRGVEFIMIAVYGANDSTTRPLFTWTNKQYDSYLARKLDRVLVNSNWNEAFPASDVEFQAHGDSDHCPSLVWLHKEAPVTKTKPFKFFNFWALHSDFMSTVKKSWLDPGKLGRREKLKILQLANLDSNTAGRNISAELEVENDLKTLEEAERLFYKQKAKIDWIREGDQGTKFFYSMVATKRKNNTIRVLYDPSGVRLVTFEDMSKEVIRFFVNQLGVADSEVNGSNVSTIKELLGFSLSSEAVDSLCKDVSAIEINEALWGQGNNKSPGPDGYNVFFFKKTWSIVGEDFLAAVRPISCCTVVYKIVTKILVDRLSSVFPNMITMNQTTFVKGRSIVDNTLLAQEIVRGYSRRRVSPRCALKIDLQKAFDSLNWDFIDMIMHAMGLPEKFIGWTRASYANPRYSIVFNDSLAVLDQFYSMLGLKLNASKCEMYAAGISDEQLNAIKNFTGFKLGSLPIRYLGVPLITRKLKAAVYSFCPAQYLELLVQATHTASSYYQKNPAIVFPFFFGKGLIPLLKGCGTNLTQSNLSGSFWLVRAPLRHAVAHFFLGQTRDLSTGNIWDKLRTSAPKVAWNHLVWFPGIILKHSIIVWMAILNSWDGELAWASLLLKGKSLIVRLLKLAWSGYVYNIWKERNSRLYGSGARSKDAVLEDIKETIRIRLEGKCFNKADSSSIALENSKRREAYLTYVSKGIRKRQDWETVMKYQRRNGSLFNSPSATVAALSNLPNFGCLGYLAELVEKFENGVPTVHPFHIYPRLCMVKALESLGIGRHFREEIASVLDETYQLTESNVQSENEIFLDPITCAMAFRILRVHGYDVSSAATMCSPELSDARISWAKNGVLSTVVDDFFDVGGCEDELLNIIQLVEKHDLDANIRCCSEEVEIIFSALHSTISEIGKKAIAWQGRNAKTHVTEIWLDLLQSMWQEAQWLKQMAVPTVNKYMTNGYVSFALGPIILPALYFIGPRISEDVVKSHEYNLLYKHVSTCGRLLNDIHSFKRESIEGKLNAVSLHMIHGTDSETKDNVTLEMKHLIEGRRRELHRLVLQRNGSTVPRECKELLWNMSKVLHLFTEAIVVVSSYSISFKPNVTPSEFRRPKPSEYQSHKAYKLTKVGTKPSRLRIAKALNTNVATPSHKVELSCGSANTKVATLGHQDRQQEQRTKELRKNRANASELYYSLSQREE